jgi:hypothetical protein
MKGCFSPLRSGGLMSEWLKRQPRNDDGFGRML